MEEKKKHVKSKKNLSISLGTSKIGLKSRNYSRRSLEDPQTSHN